MSLDIKTVVKRNLEIVSSDMDGEMVMMSIMNGEYYGIDAIGSHIWQLLDEQISIEDLCTKLCEIYDVDVEECRRDVDAFLTKMLEHKIVQIA